MSGSMANILVKDDTNTTAIEYTLVPVTDTPIPLWRTKVADVPLEGQLRLSMSEEKLKSGGYKRSMKLEVPVLETLGTAGTAAGYQAPPKVAYVETFIVTSFSSSRATQANRANAYRILHGIMAGAFSTTAGGELSNVNAAGLYKTYTARPAIGFFIDGDLPF
jgi:hypothetical protein